MSLDDRARQILRDNDAGGFTLPTKRLYPFQWNWDSAFAALGFATFDLDRAWTEIETLLEGQWSNGMVPHIIFRKEDPDYFPGPSVWQTGTEPPSSGISQPPVAASVVRRLLEQAGDASEPRARAAFGKLLAWHRWFHTQRDPDRLGVIAATHPWEAGRDNSPDWDEALSSVDTSGVGSYERRDTSHVDPSMRPTKQDYDRYLAILKFGVAVAWDPLRIYRNGPFLVADPGLTFILLRADRDLLWLADRLGEMAVAEEIASWVATAEAGADRLWSEDLGGYAALDLKTGQSAPALSSVAFLAFYAGLTDRAAALCENLKRFRARSSYAVASFDPGNSRFDAVRYWRGSVWAVINFLIGQGLADQGQIDLADMVRADTAHLIRGGGFAEYYDPVTGRGVGGQTFTWTAAVWLAWGLSDIESTQS
ncbi:MAG: hypothetical protein AAF637_16085 [Pseudomonadota bacterium]